MKRINGIKLRIGESEDTLILKVAKLERIKPNDIKSFKIVKKSITKSIYLIIITGKNVL